VSAQAADAFRGDDVADKIVRAAARRMGEPLRMNEHLPAEVLSNIKRWAATKRHIAQTFVFGSRVTGVNKHGGPVRSNSDLDIAVVLIDGIENTTMFWCFDAKPWPAELAAIVPFEVDLELMEADTPDLRRYVQATGIEVFRRQP
jgi:predicted nucleotidyltransferase